MQSVRATFKRLEAKNLIMICGIVFWLKLKVKLMACLYRKHHCCLMCIIVSLSVYY